MLQRLLDWTFSANSEIPGSIPVYFDFSPVFFSAIFLLRITCKYEDMTEKNSKSVLMRWFWLLGYLCVVRCLFVFLSECRLFHLSKLILLPSIPAAFISVAPECFVQLSSTFYCYLQICPEGQCETEAQIMASEIFLFARTMYFYKNFYH